MAMSAERTTEIDQIKARMVCTKSFLCCSSGLAQAGKVKVLVNGELLDCLESDAPECRYALAFGDGFFCMCPLRKHLAQILQI